MRTLANGSQGHKPRDLAGLLEQVAHYRQIGGTVFAVVGKTEAGPGAIAVTAEPETFLTKFFATGTPAIWHLHTAVYLELYAFDLGDPETRTQVAMIAKGRWYWVGDDDHLVDAAAIPPARADRAARRKPRAGGEAP